jgi:SSS family solute:Na+ symporter
VAQFFPGIALGVFAPRVKAKHVMAGLVVGEFLVVSLIWSSHDPFMGMNAGFVGLAVNALVTTLAFALFPDRVDRG